MKIFYKSSKRIKSKVAPEQILPSNTTTNKFPDDAATVVITDAGKSKPSFKIYFEGKKLGAVSNQGYAYQYPSYRVVAWQIHSDGVYKTHFGQNSWLPTDKIPEINEMINKIETIINS